MQVQPMYNSRTNPASTPGEQNHIHTNGVHSDTSHSYSTSTNGHFDEGNMHPYQQHPYAYGHGRAQQQQHQQQQAQRQQNQHEQHQQYQQQQQHHQNQQYPYQANQLPPMHQAGSMMSSMAPPPAPSMSGPVATTGYQPSMTTPAPELYPAPARDLYGHAAAAAPVQEAGTPSHIGNDGKYQYELRVEQQPARARMCGFGDKDRRPITPPPCVRLIITDLATGKVIKPDTTDGNFYVLQVDLWDQHGTREVNLVRSSGSSSHPSISSATTTSFPPTIPPERHAQPQYPPGMYGPPMMAQPMYGPQGGFHMAMGGRGSMSGPSYNAPMYPPEYAGYIMPPVSPGQPPIPPHQHNNMFTRNLIGSLTVNASVLKDVDGEPGFWFVLQDLSVRTEGWFQLKMNFINVGALDGSSGVNKFKAPVLAAIRTEPFQVFSAKKFPGVIDSTALSKCFAAQGIKIPIRKNEKNGEADDDDE